MPWHHLIVTRYEIEPEDSQVWIAGSSSLHPINADARGLTGWVELDAGGGGGETDPELLGGEIRIEIERLRSGNPLVDRETRRRVDAARFPEIVGTLSRAEPLGDGRFEVHGDISLRGRDHPVLGELLVSPEGDHILIEGEQTFDVREWGLTPPRIAMLRVHPEVRVRIAVRAEARSQ